MDSPITSPPSEKIEDVAKLFYARRTGPKRYVAKCPAHPDRSPSLSICAGRGGRVLVLCRAGCHTADVLAAAGLSIRDLFSGPPPSPAQQAIAERTREANYAARRHLRQIHHDGCDRLLALQKLVDTLAPRLMSMADSAEADALTAQWHEALEESRRLESILMRMEAAWL